MNIEIKVKIHILRPLKLLPRWYSKNYNLNIWNSEGL